jgi:hypothetical protein
MALPNMPRPAVWTLDRDLVCGAEYSCIDQILSDRPEGGSGGAE